MNNNSLKFYELLPKQLKSFFKKYPPSVKYADGSSSTHALEANPFFANKHPVTGRYHEPKYSLRRMSVLYKTAHLYGVESFLPPMRKKFFEEKYNNKKFMRGVLTPKGHKHELLREGKLAKMEDAIKNADRYIVEAKGKQFAKKFEKRRAEKQKSWF